MPAVAGKVSGTHVFLPNRPGLTESERWKLGRLGGLVYHLRAYLRKPCRRGIEELSQLQLIEKKAKSAWVQVDLGSGAFGVTPQ